MNKRMSLMAVGITAACLMGARRLRQARKSEWWRSADRKAVAAVKADVKELESPRSGIGRLHVRRTPLVTMEITAAGLDQPGEACTDVPRPAKAQCPRGLKVAISAVQLK